MRISIGKEQKGSKLAIMANLFVSKVQNKNGTHEEHAINTYVGMGFLVIGGN